MIATGVLTATGTASAASDVLSIGGANRTQYMNTIYAWPTATGGFKGGTLKLQSTPDAPGSSRRWFDTGATLTASGIINAEVRAQAYRMAFAGATANGYDVSFKVM